MCIICLPLFNANNKCFFFLSLLNGLKLSSANVLSCLQLQHLVSDEPCTECQEIFSSEQKRGVAVGGPCSTAHQRTAAEVAYQRRAEQTLADENCFKVLLVSLSCICFPLAI